MKARSRALTLLALGVLGATVMVAPAAFASSGHNIVIDGMFTSPRVTPVGAQHNDFCLVSNGECPTPNTKIGPWRVTAGSVDLVATNGIWQQPPGAVSNAQTVDVNGTETGALSADPKYTCGDLIYGHLRVRRECRLWSHYQDNECPDQRSDCGEVFLQRNWTVRFGYGMGQETFHIQGEEHEVCADLCEHDTELFVWSSDWRRDGHQLLIVGLLECLIPWPTSYSAPDRCSGAVSLRHLGCQPISEVQSYRRVGDDQGGRWWLISLRATPS